MYIGESKEKLVLKGKDAIIFEVLKQYSDNIDIIEVCMNKGLVFRKELLNIMKECDVFDVTYSEAGKTNVHNPEERNDQYYEDDYEEKKSEPKSVRQYFSKIVRELLNNDDKNEYIAISRKFLLGDVVFVYTGEENKIMFETDDLWLGNEGFKGTIWNSLAFVATLDFDLISNWHQNQKLL